LPRGALFSILLRNQVLWSFPLRRPLRDFSEALVGVGRSLGVCILLDLDFGYALRVVLWLFLCILFM
jgi:hypothetical protein